MINYLRYGWGSLSGAVLTGPMFMSQQPPPPPPDQPPYGEQPPYGGGYAEVPNYLPWAILVTILSAICCPFSACLSIFALIIGIFAIVKAATANTKRASGDYMGAREDANSARTWIIVSAVLLIVAIVIATFVVYRNPEFRRQLEEMQRMRGIRDTQQVPRQ